MSAIFMGRRRFSSINPDDIARVGNRNLSLNSVSFKETDAELEDQEDDRSAADQDEEKTIGGPQFLKRSHSTKSRKRHPRLSAFSKLKKRWNHLSVRYGLNHIGPILFLSLYSIIGALIFSAVELPNAQEKHNRMMTKLEENRRWAADSILRTLDLRVSNDSYEAMLLILKLADTNNSIPAPEVYTWNIWGALFYVGTIFTTIGYGNIYPETTLGYALTIIYAFFGVPLVLAILSDIGRLFAFYSNKWWRQIIARVPEIRKKPKSVIDAVMPESGVPVTLCLLLTLLWLLFCSGLFCIWEKNWTYFKAFYFFFISLSTIGLGDIVPDKPKLMIINFWLVIIGLCLVSMTLGVVQEHISLLLYRMMIELQKECEDMLANGEDVEKSDLLQRMWENQPWYVRQFMPAFVNQAEKQRLEDYASAAITDTAVNLGLIEPPLNYTPTTIQLPPTVEQPSSLLRSAAAVVTAPLAMVAEAEMRPAGAVAVTTPADVQTTETKASAEHLAPPHQPPTMKDLYPGGRAIVKRPQRAKQSPVRTENDSEDAKERLQRALKTRIATTQTAEPMSDANIQTDLLAADIVTRQETVSLDSWYAEDDTAPTNLQLFQKLTAEDLKSIPGIMEMLKSKFQDLTQEFVETSAQTDDHPDAMSTTSSSSDEDFVSAAETRSLLPTPSLRFATKSVQTTPMTGRWSSQVGSSSAEVQTISPSRVNTEVQTYIVHRQDIEVQCQAAAGSDEEAQTPGDQAHRLQRPDLLPRNWSDDAFADQASQTVSTLAYDEKEIQTERMKVQNLEMQTEQPLMETAETQTERSSLSRGSVSEGLKVRIMTDIDDLEAEEPEEEAPLTKIPGGWAYSSWISSNRDRGNSLLSVPEEGEYSEEDEFQDDEEQDEDFMEDEENIDTDQIDLPGLTEEDDDSEGLNLPAITARINYDDEAAIDEVLSMAEESRNRNKGSRHSKLSWKDLLIGDEQIITACIGTQTEELVTRRQSFPRDVFTSNFKEPNAVFGPPESKTSEVAFVAEIDKERSHNRGFFHWIKSKTYQQPKGSSAMLDQKSPGASQAESHQDVGIQTDPVSDVREIMIQTDESFLQKARKFETLRQHRTKSLAVAVAPHLKQRLAAVAAKASPHGSMASDAPKLKKVTPPGRIK